MPGHGLREGPQGCCEDAAIGRIDLEGIDQGEDEPSVIDDGLHGRSPECLEPEQPLRHALRRRTATVRPDQRAGQQSHGVDCRFAITVGPEHHLEKRQRHRRRDSLRAAGRLALDDAAHRQCQALDVRFAELPGGARRAEDAPGAGHARRHHHPARQPPGRPSSSRMATGGPL